MATKAAEMRDEGIDVINFSVGEPDFNTPEHIIDAAKIAMDKGFTKYTAGPGMIELRKAICEKLMRENGIQYNPKEVLVSNGEKQSLYNVCQALFSEGDQVITFSPYWVSFPEFIRLADAQPVIVNTIAEKNYEPDFSDLSKKINNQIKGLIINSPSNPTGGVWTEKALIRIIKMAKKHNWVLISDECYERLVYDGEFISVEKLNRDQKIGANVITCISLSKTYAMTGWRIGYSVGPQRIINAMAKIQGQATSCANSIGQMAGIEALTGDQGCVDEMRLKFLERRDHIIPLLNNLPNITCEVPGGAFYAFPDFSAYLGKKANSKILKDTFDISEYILNYAKVVTVPGDGFGAPGHIRFSYATSKKVINKGIERVRLALDRII
ncbi:MAG: aspartate aminotransferase [Candidatus Marinimicrobia bacterium]|nr:aspartate aminotransferase [Candidatus Neomarinimicrobiota bacterium]|tara:strand:- start:24587 stop:25732 length:1146 start_codon:yes stop_codon:yes gene_type:complete